jgi:hypothetical protein
MKLTRRWMNAAGGFWLRDRSGAEKPWRMLLRDELRLPWAVMGPRERVPLMRDAWICFRDLMPLSVSDTYGGGPWSWNDKSLIEREIRTEVREICTRLVWDRFLGLERRSDTAGLLPGAPIHALDSHDALGSEPEAGPRLLRH